MLSHISYCWKTNHILYGANVMLFNDSCTDLISVCYKQKPTALLESFYHWGFNVSDTKGKRSQSSFHSYFLPWINIKSFSKDQHEMCPEFYWWNIVVATEIVIFKMSIKKNNKIKKHSNLTAFIVRLVVSAWRQMTNPAHLSIKSVWQLRMRTKQGAIPSQINYSEMSLFIIYLTFKDGKPKALKKKFGKRRWRHHSSKVKKASYT